MAEEFVKNIDYVNKSIPTPLPTKISDIDTQGSLYDNIIESSVSGTFDLNTINSFTGVSRSRNEVYNLLDMMGEDPIISSALEIYAADATETSDAGRILWCESDDSNVLGAVEQILDALNIDKNAYNHIYSLCKYGDLYLRLYRKSELNATLKAANKDVKKSLNEDVILKAFSKNDRYAEYMEAMKNPAEVFDLTRFGKSCGYLKTHINTPNAVNQNDILALAPIQNYNWQFKKDDVDIYPATEFVHASLLDNSNRTAEEVSITSDIEEDNITYTVKRGQSILYNSFKIWRELSLLENSVLLNRITKSSIVRTVSVEVGDMERDAVRDLLHRIKGMIEQKSSINVGKSLQEYTNPGPIENVIYIPTHEGKGAITTSQIGGDVNIGDLTDLAYWKKKLFASIGIPGQYLGDTEDSTGFNGGTSLSLISSRYAKTVKRIQNAYIQAITDAVNLILLDRGLTKYINRFTLRMQSPTTQEEKDRKDNISNSINNVQNIMSLLDDIEDPQIKLEILKSLLSNTISNTTVLASIQDEIDRRQAEEEETTDGGDDYDDDMGDFDMDFGSSDMGGSDMSFEGSDELPSMSDLEGEAPEPESAPLPMETEENFYNNQGGEVLLEENDLPTWSELGVSYTDVQ